MKSLKSLSLLPLVVGSAAAGVLALMSPAKAVVLTVGGTAYDMTTISGSFTSNQTALQSTPWWGNATLAQNFAIAAFNASPKFESFFAYQIGVAGVNNTPPGWLAYYTSSGSTLLMNPQLSEVTSSANYANATPVPFDFDGGIIPAVVGAFVLAARWKARRSIESKTGAPNPDVAVR